MIFDFLKKKKRINEKIKLIQIMFLNLEISEEQKALYLQALDILDEDWIDRIYEELKNFVENVEIKNIEDMQKNSLTKISWMKVKEAEEKKQELNSFSLLIDKL